MDAGGGLRLSGVSGNDTGAIVSIKSAKRLKIEKVEFKLKEVNGGMDWETVIPIKFAMALVDSIQTVKTKAGKGEKTTPSGKPFVYHVRLFFNPALMEDKWGEFHLFTDLKEKKDIQVPGMLEGKKG